MKKLILMLMLFMPMATFAQKFGHVNAQEVMASMPEFIKARGEVEAQAKQYDNDLKAMQEEMQRKYEDYEKNKSTMNETKRKETEDSLSQMYQKIQQSAQDNQQARQAPAGQDWSYHKQARCSNQGSRQSRWLCLHHGHNKRHPLHQRDTQQGRYS